MAILMTGSAPATSGKSDGQTYRAALAMVTILFFFWGFVTVLNDILVPHLKSIFDLNYTKVMLIQFAFFSAYFIFSIPSAKVIDTIGYKRTMVTGLATMGVGAFLFIPAASAPSFPLFLGPPETASSRLNLTQAFNSLGTTIGPYLGGLFILNANASSAETLQKMSTGALQAYRVQEASSVKLPYTIIGIALIAFAVLIGMFKLPPMPEAEKHGLHGPSTSIWKYKHLVLGMVGIFVYVGAEVSIGSFLINYLSQPNIGNMPEIVAAKYVAYYWGGAMIGRFIGSALLQKVKTGTLLGIFGLVAALLVCTTMLTTGTIAMWSVISVGFFNSIMFPSIYTLGIAKLGPLTGDGSGLMIMAIVGGAILPVVQGAIADRIGIHHAFILPVLCYLYIAYY